VTFRAQIVGFCARNSASNNVGCCQEQPHAGPAANSAMEQPNRPQNHALLGAGGKLGLCASGERAVHGSRSCIALLHASCEERMAACSAVHTVITSAARPLLPTPPSARSQPHPAAGGMLTDPLGRGLLMQGLADLEKPPEKMSPNMTAGGARGRCCPQQQQQGVPAYGGVHSRPILPSYINTVAAASSKQSTHVTCMAWVVCSRQWTCCSPPASFPCQQRCPSMSQLFLRLLHWSRLHLWFESALSLAASLCPCLPPQMKGPATAPPLHPTVAQKPVSRPRPICSVPPCYSTLFMP
jgi:hypothetical protein